MPRVVRYIICPGSGSRELSTSCHSLPGRCAGHRCGFVFCFYLAVILLLAELAGRLKVRSLDEYLLSGRRQGTVGTAATIAATVIGAGSTISSWLALQVDEEEAAGRTRSLFDGRSSWQLTG